MKNVFLNKAIDKVMYSNKLVCRFMLDTNMSKKDILT